MQSKHLFRPWAAALTTVLMLLSQAAWVAAQPQPSRAASKPAAATSSASDQEIAAIQTRLSELLRLSPRLTAVLARDPSLLGDQEYVSRSNPELAQFLQQHPEIVRNPEFYLFSNGGPGTRFENYGSQEVQRRLLWNSMWRDTMPFIVMFVFLGAILWLLRVVLDNRRWGKILKLQNDVHNKLLDKFGNTQELLTYMNSEAGKRFLEAAPMPVSELPSAGKLSLARILLPLQIGIVVLLLGMGSFALQGVPGGEIGFHVLGMLGVMLGIGFIVSAALSFLVARHLGILPQNLKKTAVLEQENL